MNRKVAKLLRAYVGQSKRDGVEVILKDAKRRYSMTPWTRRGPINAAMREYLGVVVPGGVGEFGRLRAEKTRIKKIKPISPFSVKGMAFLIGRMLGLVSGARRP